MRFEPSYEQASITEVVRSIVADWKPEYADDSEHSTASIDKQLTDGAWTGIGIPEQFGGSGFGLYETILAVEELGAVLLPSAMRSTLSAKRALIAGAEHSESEEARGQCRDLLYQLGNEGRGAVGWASPKGATLVADAPDCELVVIFKDGVGLAGTPGDFGLTEAPSMNTTRTHARLSGDTASAGPVLEGKAAARALAEARALLAAELVGAARNAMELTVAYVSERKAFGKLVGSFQGVSHRLADTVRFVDGARVMCHAAGWHADTESSELVHYSRIALLNAQRAATHAADAAIQLHGAYGFTWESGLHWYQRHAHVAAHLLGDEKQLLRELANELADPTSAHS